MSKNTQVGAAKDVTNTANGAMGRIEDYYEGRFNPQAQANIDTQNKSQATTFAPAASGYSDMAMTGGFTPADKTAYLNRATEGVGSMTSALEQQARLANARTGGTNGAAAIAQIARQGEQGQAQALNDANASVTQQVNANKLSGLQGLGNLYNTSSGNVNNAYTQYLQGLGGEFTNLNQSNQLKAGAIPGYNSSPFSPILGPVTQLAGAIPGVAAAFA